MSTPLRSWAMVLVATLLSRTGFAEPSAEAVKLAKVTAPFVTEDTLVIAHLDIERTDLSKIQQDLLPKLTGADDLKRHVSQGLHEVASELDRLKKAGVLEIINVGGMKFGPMGQPEGPPEAVFVLRKSPNASADQVIENFRAILVDKLKEADGKNPTKTWVVGDWIAMAAEDPQVLAKGNTLRPVASLSAMYDQALAQGRGVHITFMPQAAAKATIVDQLATAEREMPAFFPPHIRSTPKLGKLIVHGKFTTLSIVASPEPKVSFVGSLADEAAARSAAGMLGLLVDSLPDAPNLQDHPNVQKLVAALTPKAIGSQVAISLKMSDESLPLVASLTMDMAAPMLRLGDEMKAQENLRQIALAILRYEEKHGQFPPPAEMIGGQKDRLQWSWRVSMLPYLGEEELYDKLDRTAAWDSPKNAALLAKMPDVFRHPGFPDDPPGTTRFAVARSKFGAFEDPKAGFGAISDGTLNTAMLVVLDKPIPWQKPGDLEVDLDNPTKGLLIANGSTTIALFDGSTRRVSAANKKLIGQILTANEGVPLDAE